jgi:hypothetical protein
MFVEYKTSQDEMAYEALHIQRTPNVKRASRQEESVG